MFVQEEICFSGYWFDNMMMLVNQLFHTDAELLSVKNSS